MNRSLVLLAVLAAAPAGAAPFTATEMMRLKYTLSLHDALPI